MAKFNLKEHIAKNKATFFGSLTEGQFSWMTQDTGQQIGSQEGNTIPVYMFDDKGKYWFEPSYDGYGVFGGMDYYELLDQMNGGRGDRNEGVRKAFDPTLEGKLLFPALVVSPNNFNYKTHDFTKEAENDPDQSWLPYEEDNNKYDDYDYGRNGFGDMDTPENYDEEDDMMKEIDQPEEQGKGPSITYPEYPETELKESPINKEVIAKKIVNYFEIKPESLRKFEEFKLDGTDDIEDLTNFVVSNSKPFPGKPLTLDQIQNTIEGFIKQANSTGPSSDEVYPYGYGRGQGFGKSYENKTTTKMKKSELKAKIKEMIVAEMELDVQDTAKEASEYDFLAELENMLNEAEGLTPLQDYVYQYEIEISGEDRAQEFLDDIKKLNTPQDVYDYYAYERDWSGSMDDDLENIYRQVKRKFKNLNEADETDTADVTVDDTETIDTATTTEVDPNVKAVQDALTQAQAAAQKLGDQKLTDQIGNTITFFTRAHVVEKGAVAEGEEMEEDKKSYYKDAEADDAEHIKALEKDMKDDKKSSMNESMFPLLKKILK